MKPVIPFVAEPSSNEWQIWQPEFQGSLATIAEVKPFKDLSEAERTHTKVAIVANPDPADLAALPNLVWVQSLWAGVERLTAELPQDGPLIVRLADPQMANTMSEAVLAWTLYLHRDMPRYMQQQRHNVWHEHRLKTPADRTVGVLGLGKLGSACALRLKSNGFNVLGWSRSAKTLKEITCLHGSEGLTNLLELSDIVVLMVPLTSETRCLIGPKELQACKSGASIINFARGPVLDTVALLGSLDRGHHAHAVLDVFNEEPLPETSPLWNHDNVTVLPHISAPTIPSTAVKIVEENIGAFLETGAIPQHVDRLRGY